MEALQRGSTLAPRYGATPNKRFAYGDAVRDRRRPHPTGTGTVVEVHDTPCSEFVVDAIDATVADDNPKYPADDPVVAVEWSDDTEKRYHFPASRLVHEGAVVDVPPVELLPHPLHDHRRRWGVKGNLGYIKHVHYERCVSSLLTGRRVSGGIELVDGHKRRWIARWADLDTVAVEVLDLDDDEAAAYYRACHGGER